MLSLPLPLLVLALAALANGAALEVASQAWTYALQQYVLREQLGRVTSIDAFGSYALILAGYALAAWATDRLGTPAILALGGGITLLVALTMLIGQATIRTADPQRKEV
ncbi:MAG: hypothetical protein OHK0015_36590 [Chloroflexi bacterium OHK40]